MTKLFLTLLLCLFPLAAFGAYGPDLCTAGTATADEEYDPNGGGYEASQAFDDAYTGNADYWQTIGATGFPHWLKYDFGVGNSETVAQYRIVGFDLATRIYDLKNWTFEGSNNDIDWDVLDTQTNETFTQHNWNTYEIANVTAYRYYMLNISANQGGNKYGIVQEMEMMEVVVIVPQVIRTIESD